jgi:hypothetical protein
MRVYRSHLSASQSKRLQRPTTATSSVNLLHSGLRRKVSEADYISLYPRMKLSSSQVSNTFAILKN